MCEQSARVRFCHAKMKVVLLLTSFEPSRAVDTALRVLEFPRKLRRSPVTRDRSGVDLLAPVRQDGGVYLHLADSGQNGT